MSASLSTIPTNNTILVPPVISNNPPLAFLLAPPPAPRNRKLRSQTISSCPTTASPCARAPYNCPTSPGGRRRRAGSVHRHIAPRTPLTPRSSFLNILDTPSPKSNPLPKPTTPAATTPKDAGLSVGLGYTATIETTFSRNRSPPRSPPRSPLKPKKRRNTLLNRLRSSSFNRILPSTTHTTIPPVPALPTMFSSHASRPQGPSSNSSFLGLSRPSTSSGGSRSAQTTSASSTSSSKTAKHSHSSHSSSEARKRYDLPFTYAQEKEFAHILGDSRPSKVATTAYREGGKSSSSTNPKSRSGKADEIGSGNALPYIGTDGQLWRDREEEMEYAVLLERRRGSLPESPSWQVFKPNRMSTATDESSEESSEEDGEMYYMSGMGAGSGAAAFATQYTNVYAAGKKGGVPAIDYFTPSSRHQQPPSQLPYLQPYAPHPQQTRAAFLASSFAPPLPAAPMSQQPSAAYRDARRGSVPENGKSLKKKESLGLLGAFRKKRN